MSSDIHRRLVIVEDDGLTIVPPPPHARDCKTQGTSRYNETCDGCLWDYYARRLRELVTYTLTTDEPKPEGRKHGSK